MEPSSTRKSLHLIPWYRVKRRLFVKDFPPELGGTGKTVPE
jgi:hypothetical protein